MPSLAVVTFQFQRITAWARSVFCGCGWPSLPVCIDNTGSAAFKHFDPLVHTTLLRTVLSILGSQLSMGLCPFHFFRHQKTHDCMLLLLLQTSSGAGIFTPCCLGTDGLQLNHAHSMPPSDLELQHDEVWAVLPVIQRKYSNIALPFLSPSYAVVSWNTPLPLPSTTFHSHPPIRSCIIHALEEASLNQLNSGLKSASAVARDFYSIRGNVFKTAVVWRFKC
jgi:hypothetical protein